MAVAKTQRAKSAELLLAVLERFSRKFDGLYGCFGPFPADDIEIFVLKLIGRLEELFKLLTDRLREIADVIQSLLRMRIPRHGKQAVVARRSPWLG